MIRLFGLLRMCIMVCGCLASGVRGVRGMGGGPLYNAGDVAFDPKEGNARLI